MNRELDLETGAVIDDTPENYLEKELASTPTINAITKEEFEDRVSKVFDILWSVLAKSFGPGGAGTFVSVYPAFYNTKDGFNIMKNLTFDRKLDQVICNMVSSVCDRLNFTVGDGTTTATIASRSMYKAYKENPYFQENKILPRIILKKMDEYKNIIIEKLKEESVQIQSDDPQELYENIRKVVSISSNDNEELTEMIASAYKELMYPALTCTLAKDGITKIDIVNGFKANVCLTDEKYVNNDSRTLVESNLDVLVFDHKVTGDTYRAILKPLAEQVGGRGRRLVCIAPYYDETALTSFIGKEIMDEMKKTGSAKLILCACGNSTAKDKLALGDLAMLLNTILITSAMEREMIKTIGDSPNGIYDVFDLDNREIPEINIAVISGERTLSLEKYEAGKEYDTVNKGQDNLYRVGFCSNATIGLDTSIFSGFYYDERDYQIFRNEAKANLEETRKKCETIGTYSGKLLDDQNRYFSLGLKIGIIEVGATSEINQGYLKDTVDDAIKAAESAYNNGVVLGCNVSTLRIIKSLMKSVEDDKSLDHAILNILYTGFRSVYATVLENVIEDKEFAVESNEDAIEDITKYIKINTRISDVTLPEDFEVAPNDLIRSINVTKSFYDVIIDYSISHNVVFNLGTAQFTKDVINSTQTDREILKATIDLLALLITGNQLVLR